MVFEMQNVKKISLTRARKDTSAMLLFNNSFDNALTETFQNKIVSLTVCKALEWLQVMNFEN
jgi:hypothetical protein